MQIADFCVRRNLQRRRERILVVFGSVLALVVSISFLVEISVDPVVAAEFGATIAGQNLSIIATTVAVTSTSMVFFTVLLFRRDRKPKYVPDPRVHVDGFGIETDSESAVRAALELHAERQRQAQT